MAANDLAASASDISNPDMQKFLHEGIPYNLKDAGELQNALKVSSEVDMTLAYTSDKSAKLENLLSHMLARENDIGTIDIEDDDISAELIEKTFSFDLLTAILNVELRELDNLMCGLRDLIVDSIHKISSSGQSVELVSGLVSKLHDSEEIVKGSQERVLVMKIQLAKLQITSISFKPNAWKSDVIMGAKEEFQLSSAEWKPQVQTVEQSRIFRMLEKSLMGEQELEKELTKFKQNEEDLNLKMCLIEQVAVCMEEAAEVAWGRFLEADNTAEVLMGISKEMVGKLQILQLNLSSSIKREEEMKSKLQDCINQLNSKEVSIQRLDSDVATLVADNAEVTRLRSRVQILEGKLNETESRLKEADLSNEMSQQKLKEMEDEIMSLKESIYDSETRAGRADDKVIHLTQSNLELSEELDFLKGSNDSNTEKASLFEKQVMELDLQLQHARLSSEASQEQQNNLYNAIWDMEILIDDLKQKVTKAESKAESTEGRCIELSETNSKLNEEVDSLRSRIKSMEAYSNQENAQLQDCVNQLKSQEVEVQRLESNVAAFIADNAEVTRLGNRVQILEEKLSETESRLKEADSSHEMSQQKLKAMGDEIVSLKESIHDSETRAGRAEDKVIHLTQSNLELSEELDFLKGSNDSNMKKASLLEKQVMELDLQLQNARLSSEASQEQQKNLYNAIWDMEILIDELKQKVVKAESKAESTEGQCIELSETNSKLNEELDSLRSQIKFVETENAQLQDCINKLKSKEVSVQRLDSNVATFIADNAEVMRLGNKVQILEGKLTEETESRLKEADLSNEMSQQKLKAMGDEIVSLKESIYDSETRAGRAEDKVHLTQSNLELSEELDFLKGSNDSNTKKASLFVKQVMELDLQLQNARLSSEASQEQQNNLYNAIWDMEILIDELKQKVAKAESKAESTEGRCIELSETNSKLNEELDSLRSRIKFVEAYSNQENALKKARAKDIDIKANFIMDTAVQLAMEREHIQNQLISLIKENKMLRANIRNHQKHESVTIQSCYDKGFLSSKVDLVDGESSITSTVTATEISSNIFKENKSSKGVSVTTSIHYNETSSTDSAKSTAGLILSSETDSLSAAGNSRRTFLVIAVLVLLLSVFAAQLFQKKLATFIMIGN